MNYNNNDFREGSEEQYDPRTAGEILNDLHPNTELGIDLKLITRTPGRIPVGAYLDGMLTRDSEDHFTFIQNAFDKKVATQRNPHVYVGRRINVNRKSDGTLYPTFNRPQYTERFTFQDFCREAAEELRVVAGLVEKEGAKE